MGLASNLDRQNKTVLTIVIGVLVSKVINLFFVWYIWNPYPLATLSLGIYRSTGHESVSCDCLGSQVAHPGCFSGYNFEFALFLSPLDCLNSYRWFRFCLFVVFLYYLVKLEFSLISDCVL